MFYNIPCKEHLFLAGRRMINLSIRKEIIQLISSIDDEYFLRHILKIIKGYMSQ